MMYICDQTQLINIEKLHLKTSHLNACANDHTKVFYLYFSYYGAIVCRGVIGLHTKNGDFYFKFKSYRATCEYLEYLENYKPKKEG